MVQKFACQKGGSASEVISAMPAIMAAYEEQATCTFNNFELKKWLRGNQNRRRRLLVKLKNDLRRLGLSRRKTRAGLTQLAIKPCVILKRLSASCYRGKEPLQSSHNIKQNLDPFHKEKLQNNYSDDAEEEQQEDNLQDIAQQSDARIPNPIVKTSISVVDASKTCRSEIQECDLSRNKSLDGTIQNFNKKAEKEVSYIDVMSNWKNIFAEKSDIKAAPSFFPSKDEWLMEHTRNFVHESLNKSSCFESETIFPKDKSTSFSAKEANMSISAKETNMSISAKEAYTSFNQNDLYSGIKSSHTTVLIRLKKHSDSKYSIGLPKNDNVSERKHKTEIKRESSSKAKLIDTSQEDSYGSENYDVFLVNSSEELISKIRSYLEVTISNFTNGNQDMCRLKELEELVKRINTSLHQIPIGKDVNEIKINVVFNDLQTDSRPIETNFKIIKRKRHSENLNRNMLPIKIRKKEVNMSEKENYKFLKRIRRCRKEKSNNKKREKRHIHFRDNFDPKSEEGHETWSNYQDRNKKVDNLSYDSVTEKEIEDKVLLEERDTLANNSQKNIENVNSDNSCDSTACTEKFCAMYDATTDEEVEDGASICKRDTFVSNSQKNLDKCDMLANNLQENIENINSDNSCDSTACTEKLCAVYDAITDEEVEDGASSCKRNTFVNLQKNIESIYSDISCDSDACTEKYYSMHDDEEIENGTSIWKHDTSDNLQENIKNVIPTKIRSENLNRSSACKEKYHATTEKDIKDRASMYNCDTLINNSQENILYPIDASVEVKSDTSSDCSRYTEKYSARNDAATKKEINNEALICTNDMLPNNLQENIENAIPAAKAKSDNSRNSTASTEKTVTIEKKINNTLKEKVSIHDMLPNNSQKNIKNAILIEVVSDNSCDFTANIEKHTVHDTASDEKTEDGASIYKRGISANNSQENIESVISTEVNSNNSNNSTSIIEKYSVLNDKASILDMLPNNSLKNIESAIPVKMISDNSCDSTVNIKKYATHDTTTDEKIGDEASIYKHGTFANNSQKNIESAIPAEIQSNNSCNSIASEKYYSIHNTITEKVEDRALICKRDMSANNLQENIESVILAKETVKKQHVQTPSSIIDMKNSSKSNTRAKYSKDIPSMINEIHLDGDVSIKNINLNQNIEKKSDIIYAEEVTMQASLQNRQENLKTHNVGSIDLQRRNVQKHATLNSKLSITSAYESCNVNEKDNCDMSQNVGNVLPTSNDNIAKDEKTIQLLMTALKSEKNSLEKRSNDSLSIQSSSESATLSKSDYSDNLSLDSHLSDDDNSDNIEVEIKIKPKLKSRVSRKFSIKAPWSSVNTCIKNLHTLKDNPSVLNDLFQMNSRISEKSININPEGNMFDDNKIHQNITVETNEIISDSSPITKDNANHSQQHNVQEYSILKENRNVIDCNQEKRNKRTQSVIQKTRITTENNLGSSKLACDTSDSEKQLQKASANGKQKTSEEQNSGDTLEKTGSMIEHNQNKKIECILPIEKKKTQTTIPTENNPESVKAVYDASNVEQLPQTSSDITHRKVRVRSIAELSCQCTMNSTSLSASTPRNVCSAFCQSAFFQSASSQLAPQSASSQSALSQSIPFQSVPLQSAPLQSAPLQSAPLQSVPLQSVPLQSVPLQSAPLQSIHSRLASPRLASPRLASPRLASPRLTSPRLTSPQSAPSQSVSKQPPPSYDATLKHIYLSPNTSSSVEINNPNINNDFINLIQSTIKNVCLNIGYCRDLIRYKLLRMHASEDYLKVQRLCMSTKQIKQGLEKLQIWLHMNDIESVINYVNLHMPINQPLTIMELTKYFYLIQSSIFCTQTSKRKDAKSKASKYPNVSESLVPDVSMLNVNAPSFLRIAPFPDVRMPNRDVSLTIPYPVQTIPNVNQQQSFGNSANSTQVPFLSQPTSNIRQQHMFYVPPTVQTHMPSVNQQQSLRKEFANTVQSRYISPNMFNAGIQQGFVNMNNVSSSNANIRSRGSLNQGNANVPPTTSMRQSYASQKSTISSTATASVANAQQQKQMYFQTSQINSGTVCSPSMTNQNIPLGVHQTTQNVALSGSFTDTPNFINTIENVRHRSANMNQQASCSQQIFQASTEKKQSLPQYIPNSNEVHPLISQFVHCNRQTHPVHNTLPDQNMWHIPQQKLPVNQENANMPPTTNTRQSYATSKNTISSTTTATIQRFVLPKDTFIYPIDLSINDTLQNVQQNVRQIPQQKLSINKENANISPTTNIRQSHVASKNTINSITIAKSQRLILPNDTSACPINLRINDTQNVQQNVLNKEAEMSQNCMQKKAQSVNLQQAIHQGTSSASNVSQNVSGNVPETSTSEKSNILRSMIFESRKDNAVLIKQKSALMRLQANDVFANFNLAILTDIQKIVLREQIKSYFTMSDEQKNSLNKQEFEQVHYERVVLFYFYWNLDDYIKNLMKETQKKSVEKDSQDDTSQNRSVLQENTTRTSVDELMKTQSNRDNEINLVCNRNLEKHSSEQNIDPNVPKNSKSTAIKNSLKASNEPLFIPVSVITKKSLPKDTRLQEQDTLKKQVQKSSLVDMEKESESAETLAKTFKDVGGEFDYRSVCKELGNSPEHSKTSEGNSITEVSAKNSETKAQNNVEINESLKMISSHENQFPDLYLIAQNSLTSLQDASIKKIDQSNAKGRSSNAETENVCEIDDVATLNNSGKNDVTLRAPCNMKDQNKEVCNASEISNENRMHDNVGKNTEILNFSKVQSDLSNILCSSESSSLNNTRKLITPMKKCESTKILELSIAHEKDVETTSETTSEFNSSIQQDDFTNERSNDSTDVMSESSEKLCIDESAIEKQEQCDKVSSSEEDNLSVLQDSTKLCDRIRYDSTKLTSLSFLKNTSESNLSEICQDFEFEAQDELDELNKKQPLKTEKMQLQDTSLKLEDDWNMEESMIQSIDNVKKHEDTKEEDNDEQLKAEEIELQQMSLKFEDTSSIENSAVKLICLELSENIKEKQMETDTHSNIKTMTTKENSEQSMLKVEIEFQEVPKFKHSEDTSIEESLIESTYLKLPKNVEKEKMKMNIQKFPEDIETEKMKIDTHSGIKAISEQLKHVYEQKYYRKLPNFVQKNNPLDVQKVSVKNDFLNANIIECISMKSDDDSDVPNIVNIRSISPSLFETIENIDAFLQNDSQSNENDEKSLDINDNLGIIDEIDNRPCLRCKRKSMVYCQACLEAHYCSKRCSSLHWNAEHHKQCKGHNPIICID